MKKNPYEINKKKFSESYDEYIEPIYRYCLYRSYSKETAEDLAQETFIRAWKYLQRGGEIKEMRPFLYQVARNLIIDFHRKNKKLLNKRSIDEMIRSNRQSLKLSYRQDQEIESRDMLKRVLERMRELPKSYQDILIMRHVDGMKIKEIAKIFKSSEKNISAKNRRAMKRIATIAKGSF